ncbi:MAG: PA2779 family protein [Betaproteobacteria bacterium]|nr:PA2779 family protein [Betaproteobacteria bacterium]
MWKLLKKVLAITLVATTMHLGMVTAVQAALVGTETVGHAARDAAGIEAQRAKVAAFLDRADVVHQLDRLGIAPAEAKARVAAMSDDEVLNAAGKIDSMPAGGDGFGAVLGVALVVFIVLLITDILGFTKVFSFTRPIKR